jgi:DNA-binding GntR family transcriptional regulator
MTSRTHVNLTGPQDRTPALRPLPLPSGPGQHATKLSRSVYSGWVAATLREAIIDGELEAGTPLVEMRLAEQLSVSRGPVRSALHVLEGEGLVRTMPNGRTAVVGFDDADLKDLLGVRYEMESTAIRWAVARRADITPLEGALEAIRAEGGSTPRLVELDIDFHRTMVELAGSRFLVHAWLAIAPVLHTVITIGNRRLAARDPNSNFTRIVESHEPLIAALAAADADAAIALLADQFGITRSMFSNRDTTEKRG